MVIPGSTLAALSIIYSTQLLTLPSVAIAVHHLGRQGHSLPPLYIAMPPSSAAAPPPIHCLVCRCSTLLPIACRCPPPPSPDAVVCSRLPSRHHCCHHCPTQSSTAAAIADSCHHHGQLWKIWEEKMYQFLYWSLFSLHTRAPHSKKLGIAQIVRREQQKRDPEAMLLYVECRCGKVD